MTSRLVCALVISVALGAGCGESMDPGGDATACVDCAPDGSIESICGDGFLDPTRGEVCDDGNTEDDDGCSADCMVRQECGNGVVEEFLGEVCDDGNRTSGDGCSADCLSDEVCGNAVVDTAAGEECDDGNEEVGDGCFDCRFEACGDGVVGVGEECDDGNDIDGDGCDRCKWTCVLDVECDDGAICNGAETCDLTTHTCAPGMMAMDGTACARGTEMGICRGGGCVASACGDGVTDTTTGEECDDGNAVNGDGCDNDCTFSCSADAECDDGAICNGAETCESPATASSTCAAASSPAPDGTSCGSALICVTGACVSASCGDGFTGAGEECDDGNTVDGDGCDVDCTYTCSADADCADAEPCNGDETCTAPGTTSSACAGGTPLADGVSCGGGLVCNGGVCTTAGCGDGVVSGAEECDDGNTTDGDGCDNDCTWTCDGAADCDDGATCNGAESCTSPGTLASRCAAGTPPPDGTSCGSMLVCVAGACVMERCGDGLVSGAEECDDGNTTDGDGCDNDCTYSCTADAECADADPCNGAETCDLSTHACAMGTPAADGTMCDLDGSASTVDICLGGSCVRSRCGDSFVHSTEECDDGNTTDGDGCDNDCTFTCTSDGECDDGLVCDGAETCNLTTHVCEPGTPPADGTLCDADGDAGTRDICLSGTCAASICGDAYVDTGEECDDGNGVSGDGCEPDCTVSAAIAYRVTQIELVDPHFYDGVGLGCLDLTNNINRDLQDGVDGYTINYVMIFRPLDLSMSMVPMDFVTRADCMSGTPRDSCSLGAGTLIATTANNMTSTSDVCYTADPSTTNPAYSAPNEPSGPCFVTDEESPFPVDNTDYLMPFSYGTLAATYGTGSPPSNLVTGVMATFLTEADAQATVYPLSSLVYAGDTVYEHLAAGGAPGSSCSTEDDRDTYMGTVGFWYYVNFTAERIDWM